MTIEEALEQFDTSIKRLKAQYDMFLLGTTKRQPFELRKQVDGLARGFNNYSMKYHHRFQLNTLTGHYNALCELWNKQLRALEEGRPIPGIGMGRNAKDRLRPAGRAPSTPSADSGAAAENAEQVVYSIVMKNPESEEDSIRSLYERYLEARQTEGGRPQIRLESFAKQVAKQAETLKASSGCDALEFRILRKGESITLKARKGR